MVPYRVFFGDIVYQVLLSLFPEYVEMVLLDFISDPIKYYIYCTGYFSLLFC